MLKHLGLVICALASVGAGVWHAAETYRRVNLLSSLSLFAEAVREGVVVYARDQMSIYTAFRNKALEDRGFLPLLRQETEMRPWGALYRAAKVFLEKADPGRKAKDAFLTFARDFGTLGMVDQAKACDEICGLFSSLAQKERDALGNAVRLSLTTGAAAGCGVLILFW